MLSRRRWFELALGGATALAVVRLARKATPARAAQPRARESALDPAARGIVAAIAPVMLAGALPELGERESSALRDVVDGTDAAIASLTPSVQREIAQLFKLLGFPPARFLVAGVHGSWEEAGAQEIERFLQSWRTSRIATFRSGYDALHQLILAAWYGNPAAWRRIGYPGPPALGKA